MKHNSKHHDQIATVFSLALAHLRHEWILTMCLIAALSAVIAPLLILMGLKVGVITTLRDELVEDPAFREIRPAITREYDEAWLEKYRNDDRVSYIVPSILPASSIVYVLSGKEGDASSTKQELLDLNPTIDGDILLLENNIAVPIEGECVLTQSAASKLEVSVGDAVIAKVTRSTKGKQQYEEESLRVIGILPARANSISAIYTTLAFVEDVEAYKEGRNVEKRHWKGDIPIPHMTFDRAFVLVPEALDQISANGLAIDTGFHYVRELPKDGFYELSNLKVPDDWYVYQLGVMTGSVTISSIEAVKGKLRGKNAVVIPYADDIVLKATETEFPVFGVSLDARDTERLHWPTIPWGKLDKKQTDMQRVLQIILPENQSKLMGHSFDLVNSELRDVPLNTIEGTTNISVIPAELLGMLNTAKKRQVIYDANLGTLILQKAGYRGFRLYAKSIDDVPDLVRNFRQQENLDVIAEVGAIERIQVLDKGLSKLFWLIAIMGIVGAVAVLMSSLYAAVEREVKNLGILRLLGLARLDVFWFPVFQGIIISVFSMIVSTVAYLILAEAINYSFGGELPGDNSICQLPLSYLVIATLAVLLLATLSSFLAAWKATNIETAEAIREE